MSALFLPSVHGFPFANSFPARTPILEIPTPLGRIPIGDAGAGVCGGMIFASLDYFLAGRAIPAQPTPGVFRYLCQRLLDSFSLPFGVLKYYDWQCRPHASRALSGVCVQRGVHELTLQEWSHIRAQLDSGMPATLGLVKAHSFSPRALTQHHQVLACGYSETEKTITIRVYDPNYPGDDHVALRLDCESTSLLHSREGPSVRGFFQTEYCQSTELPSPAAS